MAHAQRQAAEQGLDCDFVEGDIRQTHYGEGFDLVMLIFGELNVFEKSDAALILDRAQRALCEGGTLLIEIHTLDAIERIGRQNRSWYRTSSGLFSARPHLQLQESFWDPAMHVCTTRYFTIDAETKAVARHAASMQGYTDDEYRDLLRDAGFTDVSVYPSMLGVEDQVSREMGLRAWTALKR